MTPNLKHQMQTAGSLRKPQPQHPEVSIVDWGKKANEEERPRKPHQHATAFDLGGQNYSINKEDLRGGQDSSEPVHVGETARGQYPRLSALFKSIASTA